MMRLLLALLLASPAAGANVDAKASFKKFCDNYCGSGGVANCDIGSGKIDESAQISFKPSRLRRSPDHAPIPARDADRNTSSGINCDEKDGNTCQKYGSDYGWCNYPQFKCMAKYMHDVTDKQYSNIVNHDDPKATGFVFTHWIDNNSSLQQDSTVEFDETTTASATLTLSNTVSVGLEISITEGVPLVMSSTFKETFKMSTTETSAKTLTTAQHWSITQPIKAPPRTTMKAELIIRKTTVSGDWTAQVDFPYDGKIWCNDKVGSGHNEWFIGASSFISTSEFGYPDLCSGNTCKVTAKFNGWHGVDSQVKITQCKLGSRSCGSEASSVVV